jgi:hypothetical protein
MPGAGNAQCAAADRSHHCLDFAPAIDNRVVE